MIGPAFDIDPSKIMQAGTATAYVVDSAPVTVWMTFTLTALSMAFSTDDGVPPLS